MPAPPRDFERFTRATDLIYSAAVTPSLWPDLLHELAQSVSCHFGGMVINSTDRSLCDGTAVGVGRDAHQAYLRRFHRTNPLGRSGKAIIGAVEESRVLMSRAALERTEIYEAFWRPHELGEGVHLAECIRTTDDQFLAPVVAGLVRHGGASLDARPGTPSVPRG